MWLRKYSLSIASIINNKLRKLNKINITYNVDSPIEITIIGK